MPKCELSQVTPASLRIFRSSAPLYFARSGETRFGVSHRRTQLDASETRRRQAVLTVPGKSFAIISRTGQVWHPIGIPSGLARSSRHPPQENSPPQLDSRLLQKPSLIL